MPRLSQRNYSIENRPKYKHSLKKVAGSSFGGQGLDYSIVMTKLDEKRPVTAVKVDKDEDGNIRYPIIVTNTLKILNLAVVKSQRPSYHSARNLSPNWILKCT